MEPRDVPAGRMDHMIVHLFSIVAKRGLHKVDGGKIIREFLDTKRGLRFTPKSPFNMIPDGFDEYIRVALDEIIGEGLCNDGE